MYELFLIYEDLIWYYPLNTYISKIDFPESSYHVQGLER